MARRTTFSAEYEAYMASDAWRQRRREWFSEHGKWCRGCRTTKRIHLHHRTYKRFTDEFDEDLVALCADCHENVHIFHRSLRDAGFRVQLASATDRWIAQKHRGGQPTPPKPAAQPKPIKVKGKRHKKKNRRKKRTAHQRLVAQQRSQIRSRPRPVPVPGPAPVMPGDEDFRAAAIAAGKYARTGG